MIAIFFCGRLCLLNKISLVSQEKIKIFVWIQDVQGFKKKNEMFVFVLFLPFPGLSKVILHLYCVCNHQNLLTEKKIFYSWALGYFVGYCVDWALTEHGRLVCLLVCRKL